ncbi:spermidine synthase [Streptomyces sp. Z26]|uniref:spermidine synthase n=1 Tax=Streptomyces sp. Z26 TaxID=2500177 RepID=UPI000EF147A8|nr:spermidine synthase [Streptomyces sp. Z26]RLL68857.1 spermidine synthase [Streptomyces sp. Z26]
MYAPEQDRPAVLDRRTGPYGEVVLRRHGDRLEIIANGCFLMDTSDGRSERLLVRSALAALPSEAVAADDASAAGPGVGPHLLLGGLGVGFSLDEAAAETRWGRITVVEREAAVLDWHRSGPLGPYSATARADARTQLVHADLLDHLRDTRDRYDVLCLDIDNGPDWTVTDGNRSLYSPAGLAACRERLAPGGVLAVWSAGHSAAFAEVLRNNGFCAVRTEETPVARGVPDVVHFATRPA